MGGEFGDETGWWAHKRRAIVLALVRPWHTVGELRVDCDCDVALLEPESQSEASNLGSSATKHAKY